MVGDEVATSCKRGCGIGGIVVGSAITPLALFCLSPQLGRMGCEAEECGEKTVNETYQAYALGSPMRVLAPCSLLLLCCRPTVLLTNLRSTLYRPV